VIESVGDGGLGLLLLGLVVGMQHALEADHVAAVSSIAARQSSVRQIISHGAVWGIGHTATLMAVAGGVVVFGLTIDKSLARWLELMVGVMLVGLGAHLIVTLVRDRIHFHRHHHKDGTTHFHAHSHRGEGVPHDLLRHDHVHFRGLPMRSLLVGMTHGMAGSAALVVLTAASANSAPLGFGYIFLFGVGSILGMAALSAVIAVPLAWSARTLTWANRGLQGGIGLATVALGTWVATESLRSLLAT
jgi:ABC-type nickel/cobalt efflux system permease component RcnA